MNRLPALLFAYAIGAGMLAADRFALLNPDGISYISIAQHWSQGRFADAVNAYWSPLFSWLMVPWLIAGVPPLAAAKVTLFLSGAAAIAAFWRLVRRVTSDETIAIATTLLLAVLVVEWGYSLVTPDLIAVAIFLFYLAQLNQLRGSGSERDAVTCGLLGALMYLNKAVGLPLFLAHFTFAMLRPSTLRQWSIGVAACAAGAAPWIAAMWWKYGVVTLGTAGAHNWRLMGPQVNRFEPFWSGLVAPPGPTAISAWEDPSSIVMPTWSVIEQPAHLGALVTRHWPVLASTLWARSPYVPILVIGIVALALVFRDRRATVVRDALAGIVLVAMAALPFVIEERYVWIIPALALLLGAYLIDRLQSRWPATTPTAIAVLSVSIVVPAIAGIRAQPAQAEDMRRYVESAAALPADLHGARMAMNPFSLENGGAPWATWNDGLYLSWYGGLKYYGVVRAGADASAIAQELAREKIDAFVWVGPQPPPVYLDRFRQVAALPLLNARVFSPYTDRTGPLPPSPR